MKRSRFTDSQIMEALKRAEAGLALACLFQGVIENPKGYAPVRRITHPFHR